MSFDDKTRAKIMNDNLKIQCRVKEKQYPHEPFGERLLNMMKSVCPRPPKEILVDFI